MKILLDTHAFLWMVEKNKKKLSPRAIELLENKNNELFLSIVSLWEISIKDKKGKLELKFEFDELINKQ